jgi:hypothetical protein
MKVEKPKKRGRPMKRPVPGERTPLGLRVTAELKENLEQAAIQSGRSLSQEAELRLEKSFERDFILKSIKAWAAREFKK